MDSLSLRGIAQGSLATKGAFYLRIDETIARIMVRPIGRNVYEFSSARSWKTSPIL
jgi:hypothetical protein